MFVSMGSDSRREVTKTLMPQFPFCSGSQCMDRCLLKDDLTAWMISIRQWKLFWFILQDSELFQRMGVNGSNCGIIARFEKGRIICFSLVDELLDGCNGMILRQDWRNEWMSACTAKDDDRSHHQVFPIDSLVVASDNNLPSVRVTMFFKLEFSIQCILKLSLGWVKAFLNSQAGVIFAVTSCMDEILFIQQG